MKANKKKFENLFQGDRSFSVISSIMAYFSQFKTDSDIESLQKEQWNQIDTKEDVPQSSLKHLFYKIQYQILLEKTQRQKRLMIRFSQVAAILILPLALFFLYQNNQNSKSRFKDGFVEMHCPKGIRTKFSLPDGSTGWLAGGSVLKYATDFNKQREVSVEGEAFFKVKRDEKRPFHVKLNDFDVRVLGTQFNVLNYADHPISEVVVLSGLVEVNGNSKQFSEKLTANKKLQLQRAKNELILSEVNAKSYTAWIDGRLEFNNESLESISRKIERFYDVDVDLSMDGLENQLFRASIKMGSIDELLEYMELILPIQYELSDAKKSGNGDIEQRKLKIMKR